MSRAFTEVPSANGEQPDPGRWNIDPVHSFITFRVVHFTINFARGMAAGPSGVITIAPDVLNSSVMTSVDAATVTTLNPVRDAKIHGPEVLDVERYATIDFRSTGLRRLDANHYQVDGPLTLHGVTKEITLEMTYNGAIVDTWGKRRLGVTAEAVLARDDFGSGEWGRVALVGGGFLVPSRVEVTMDIEATLDEDVES
jgi:polyisoprenoid-binding protein YceI